MPWGMILGPAFGARFGVDAGRFLVRHPQSLGEATGHPVASGLADGGLEEGAHGGPSVDVASCRAAGDRAQRCGGERPPVRASVVGRRAVFERTFSRRGSASARWGRSSSQQAAAVIRLLRSCRAVEPICNAEAQWCRCDARVGAKDGWVRFERDDRRRWRISGAFLERWAMGPEDDSVDGAKAQGLRFRCSRLTTSENPGVRRRSV